MCRRVTSTSGSSGMAQVGSGGGACGPPGVSHNDSEPIAANLGKKHKGSRLILETIDSILRSSYERTPWFSSPQGSSSLRSTRCIARPFGAGAGSGRTHRTYVTGLRLADTHRRPSEDRTALHRGPHKEVVRRPLDRAIGE